MPSSGQIEQKGNIFNLYRLRNNFTLQVKSYRNGFFYDCYETSSFGLIEYITESADYKIAVYLKFYKTKWGVSIFCRNNFQNDKTWPVNVGALVKVTNLKPDAKTEVLCSRTDKDSK